MDFSQREKNGTDNNTDSYMFTFVCYEKTCCQNWKSYGSFFFHDNLLLISYHISNIWPSRSKTIRIAVSFLLGHGMKILPITANSTSYQSLICYGYVEINASVCMCMFVSVFVNECECLGLCLCVYVSICVFMYVVWLVGHV